MPTLEDVLPELTNAKVFSLLDAKDGFLQVRLSDQSSFLRWLRLPFGLSSAPEEFQRRLQAALYGIDGVVVVADDILIYGKGNTQEEARGNHDEALLQVLRWARKCNLKFNKDKLRLHLPELQYIGHRISSEGVRPDPAKVAAIKNMPTPTTVTQVRSFLGMCNYLAKFVQNLSQATEPLRRLTENNVKFVWDEGEQRCFDQVKELISGDLLLAYYDMSKPVTIHCDASMDGLGATLLQEGLPVMSVSRSLGKSEKNYVAIELECLAIVFACRKFDRYIYGKRTVVETDHKPLEVICKKSILAAPKRLQRMLLSLLRYDLVVVYRPGKEQVLADALSRLPVKTLEEEELEQEEVFQAELDAELLEISAVQGKDAVHVSDQRLLEVKKASVTDEEQKALQKLITLGWPTRFKEVPALARKYWNFWESLVIQDGITYKGEQVVVPQSLRTEYLKRLHTSHMGRESTLRRAKDAVYWPNMARDVENMINTCRICEEDAPAQAKEKHLAHEIPKQPWVKVGMDLFRSKGEDCLLMVGYLTDFFEISKLPHTLTTAVITACKEQFARHGIPELVHTDGGPQFMSYEFGKFAKEWEFAHSLSAPYHSQSNGKAEAAVKIVKRLLKRNLDPYRAILEWRNTPTVELGTSPCQRLFGRRTRGVVPVPASKLMPSSPVEMWEKKAERQRKIQEYKTRSGRNLPPLQVGEPVLVQDVKARKTQWERGYCRDKLSSRSYVVEVERMSKQGRPSGRGATAEISCQVGHML